MPAVAEQFVPDMSDVWHPIKVSRQLVLEGGYQNKAHRVESKDVATPDGDLTFVKIDKKQDWLVKSAAGKNARPGSLSRTTLVEVLKKELVAAVEAQLKDEPSTSSAAIDDPMAALAALEPGPITPKKRKCYISKRMKNNIVELTMPEHEPTAHPGQEGRTRQVRVLATSTNTLWLLCEDVGWLVTWLADEHQTGGIAPLEPAVAGEELKGNCLAPGVHIRWDFEGAWEATFLEGERKGKTVKSRVEKLTPEKWATVDAVHHYGTDFLAATPAQMKQATYHFLELHMQNVTTCN